MFGGLGNNQNNNNGAPNINTKIRTLFGDISCLQLTYWNENLSIRINPLMSINEQGIRQYDYNKRGITALTADKCLALSEKIKSVILPAIYKVYTTNVLDKPLNVGFSVGNKGTAFFIEYKPDNKGVPSLYATLYTNMSQDNKAPQDGVYSYKFTKTPTVDNYDPETGTGSYGFVEAEFMFFYDKIRTIADVFGTAAHSKSMDRANRPSNNNNGNGGFNNGGNSKFNNAPQNNYTAPVSNFDPNDLPF